MSRKILDGFEVGQIPRGGLMVFGGNSSSTLLNELYAFWKMNEFGSVTRVDSVGGSHLTVAGTVDSATGVLGNAANFTGNVANYLSCAHNADISPAGTSFTIALWVKINTIVVQGFIGKFGGAGGSEFIIDYAHGQSPCMIRFLTYGFNVGALSINTFPNDTTTWHAIRAGYNMATRKTFIQYDASAFTEQAVTGAINVSDSALKFGVFEGVSRPGNCALDHIGFWKRVLTDDEWVEFYSGGVGKDFVL